MKSFAELVRQKRERLGLSTQEFAQRVGVPEEIVLAIESGSFLPPSFFLPVIIRSLGGDETGELREAYHSEAMTCFGFG